MKIGIQTRPWGPEANRQRLGEVLADVQAAGYDGIEIGAQHLDLRRPGVLLRLLEEHSLSAAGIHVGGEIYNPDAIKQARADLERAAAYAAEVGAPHLAFSGKPFEGKTAAMLAAEAANLNRVGEICQGQGLTLAYHNHNWEIERNAAELRFLRDHTDPALVSFLLDVAWVARGGGSPVEITREFLPRLAYLHLKDTRGDEWLELGRGIVDFPKLFEVIRGRAFPWLVVEQDETKRRPVESARMSRDYLREKWAA